MELAKVEPEGQACISLYCVNAKLSEDATRGVTSSSTSSSLSGGRKGRQLRLLASLMKTRLRHRNFACSAETCKCYRGEILPLMN